MKKPRLMVVGPQGDGLRGLHVVLSEFVRSKYDVFNYIDIGASFSAGSAGGDMLTRCRELAASADALFVILGSDPGQPWSQRLTEPLVPFTQHEVEAFLASTPDQRKPFYTLIRAAVENAPEPPPASADWPRFGEAVAFAKWLRSKAPFRQFTLGGDLRQTLVDINRTLELGREQLCQELEAKYSYQENVFRELDAPTTECYLSVVGNWRMLHETQLERLQHLTLQEAAVIGPRPNALTLPGILQRLYVNEVRKKAGNPPLALLSSPGDPVYRYVVFGSVAIVQAAATRGLETRHQRVEGEAALTLRDAFRDHARHCMLVDSEVWEHLQRTAKSALGRSLVDVVDNVALQRRLHAQLIDDCARAFTTSQMTARPDPNLHMFNDGHLGIVVAGLVERFKQRVRKPSLGVGKTSFPDVRFVFTDKCPLKCHYCPEGNEDFPPNVAPRLQHRPRSRARGSINDALRVVAMAAETCGSSTLALTGGEPTIIPGWYRALSDAIDATRQLEFQLQTSGYRLLADAETLPLLVKHSDRLRIKLSYDSAHAEVRETSLRSVHELVAAGFPRAQLEVNYVCDRMGVTSSLEEALDLFRELGIGMKLLDVIWYEHMGNRVPGAPRGDEAFREAYAEMQLVRDLLVEKGYRRTRKLDKRYGVREDLWFRDDHQVRTRDSQHGAAYGQSCVVCPYYHDGRCQEGVYQIDVTSDLLLKLCWHRKDISLNIESAISEDLANRSGGAPKTAALFTRFFEMYYARAVKERRFQWANG